MVSKNGPWLHPGKHCIKATCVSAFAVKRSFPGRVNERRRCAAAGGGSRGFISGVMRSERCDVITYTSCDESGEASGEQRSDESDEPLKIQNSF